MGVVCMTIATTDDPDQSADRGIFNRIVTIVYMKKISLRQLRSVR